MEKYYEILGVTNNSTSDDIKKAYRKLSLKHHPDKNGGNATTFKKINEAYQTLGNPEKRKMYDMHQNNPFFSGNQMMGNPEDFLNMMFGGGMPGGMPFGFGNSPGMGMPQVRIFRNGIPVNMNGFQKPSPIIKTIEITLEQAYTGINYPLKIEKWVMEGDTKRIEQETIYVDIKAAIETYVNEFVGLKETGYGDVYFQRTLEDWAKFNINNRTKHDASISSGLALMACNKHRYTPGPKRQRPLPVDLGIKKYDNKGSISKIIS